MADYHAPTETPDPYFALVPSGGRSGSVSIVSATELSQIASCNLVSIPESIVSPTHPNWARFLLRNGGSYTQEKWRNCAVSEVGEID